VPFAKIILLKLFMKSHNNFIAQNSHSPLFQMKMLENISLLEEGGLKGRKESGKFRRF